MNKNQIRNLFVRFIKNIGLVKQFGDVEDKILATIGAMSLRIDELQADPQVMHTDEIEFYREAIVLQEKELRDVQETLFDYKEGSEVAHQKLLEAAFVEQEAGIQYHFLLPYHTTLGQRTLVPGFNSMAHADVDSIKFIEVHRILDANNRGTYLIYPTMGEADFGAIA